MSWFERTIIANKARDFAKETIINPDKEAYFIKGVDWALNRFLDVFKEAHGEYDSGVKKMFDEFRLKDFKDLVRQLTAEKDLK